MTTNTQTQDQSSTTETIKGHEISFNARGTITLTAETTDACGGAGVDWNAAKVEPVWRAIKARAHEAAEETGRAVEVYGQNAAGESWLVYVVEPYHDAEDVDELPTVYCTHARPVASDVAREEHGPEALLGYPYGRTTAPYSPETHHVVGYVAAHRSGPRIPVVKPRATTPKFTPAALACIAETGADHAADLAALRAGRTTPAALLAHCLDGADDDRAEGWRDYVSALETAAGER